MRAGLPGNGRRKSVGRWWRRSILEMALARASAAGVQGPWNTGLLTVTYVRHVLGGTLFGAEALDPNGGATVAVCGPDWGSNRVSVTLLMVGTVVLQPPQDQGLHAKQCTGGNATHMHHGK